MWRILTACSGDGPEPDSSTTEPETEPEAEPDLDVDDDGYTKASGDCDDEDPGRSPDASEVPGDGVDSNCDGTDVAVVIDLDSVGPSWSATEGTYDLGWSVRIVPDLDQDGLVDLLAGAPNRSAPLPESEIGYASWFVFTAASDGLDAAWASWGSTGTTSWNDGGYAVGGSADLTGDGLPDLVLPAPGGEALASEARNGVVYLVSGPEAGVHSVLDADASVDGTETGSEEGIGQGVLGEHDWTGDGAPDLLTVVRQDLCELRLHAGPIPATILADDHDLAIPSADLGLSLGDVLLGGVDVDSDGYGDLWITDDNAALHAGRAYLLRGPLVDGDLDAVAVATVTGEGNDGVGTSLAVGDFDGDGAQDTAVGAFLSNAAELVPAGAVGAVGVFFGPVSGAMAFREAPALIIGETRNARVGAALASGVDFDRDGRDDLVIGAPNPGDDDDSGLCAADCPNIGSPGLLFVFGGLEPGSRSTEQADYALRSPVLDDWAGGALHGGGDLDGDGILDVAYGASRNSGVEGHSGRVGVVSGGAVREALGL